MSINKAVACIKKYKTFLIASHTNMEGDALGSELAFYLLIKKLGKRAIILNEDNVPYGYDFLPRLEVIRKFKKNIKNLKFDCFTVLDCSDLKRTGEVYTVNKNNQPVLNIDHHISNIRFGTVNWVEPDASCTCEMLYKLYRKLKVKIDKDAALCLYAGILTDTGSFRYTNTRALTHKITADLLCRGVSPLEVYKNVYGNIPFADLKLFTRILPTMQRIAGGKLVYFQIARDMLRKNLCFDLSENILTFARMIKDIEVAVLFKENLGPRNEVRVNFRSQGKIDVNKIAQFFGGGGHKTASGATVKGRLQEVKNKVLKRIKQALHTS